MRFLLIPLALATAAGAATTFDENFDASTSLPAGWASTGDASIGSDAGVAQSPSNYLIMGTRNSNSATTQALGLDGATEATISFSWSTQGTYGSAFGRRPQIEYSPDGTTFFFVAEFTVPTSNDGSPVPYTPFSETISTATPGLTFTDNSVFRITGDNDAGGNNAPLIVDDISITSDAVQIPEASGALMAGLSCLFLFGRRRG